MRKLLTTLCIAAVLPFGTTEGWGADFQKGLDAAVRGDHATALHEWIPLAEQGNAAAQFQLGWMYSKGEGVSEDDQEAVKWYRLAAEQRHAHAQYNLGLLYESGYGVLQDNIYAHMWGNISALNQYVDGLKLRDRVEKKMTVADISVAQKLARECEKKEYKGC